MAIAALAGVIGKALLQDIAMDAITDSLSQLSQIASTEFEKSITDVAGVTPGELKVVEITSKTWYARNLANRDNWTKARKGLNNRLEDEIPEQYLANTTGGEQGIAPFDITVSNWRDGLVINCKAKPGKKFELDTLRAVVLDEFRSNTRALVRSAAIEGKRFGRKYKVT